MNTHADGDGSVDIVELGPSQMTTPDAQPSRAVGKPPRRTRARRSPSKTATGKRSVRRGEAKALHRLVARSELGRTGVVSVDTPYGRLAAGISNGRPFAVSDTCRHLFASLGEGRVLRDGCLQCPWHRSRYDVTSGKMVRGPQGLLFLSVREIVRAYTNLLFPLKTYPVVERAGVLYLDTAG